MITSPFIENAPVVLEKNISKQGLISSYQRRFKIDITELLSSADTIRLYRCSQSGYQFYYPFTITGNSQFYEQLQENEWYYMPWKWEHEICEHSLKPGDKLLEVGCGSGAFLKQIGKKHKNIQCVGLELNESSVYKEDNIEIINDSIEHYAEENKNKFDIVCSFQVLEHIPSVKSFLQAQIQTLKKDGLLVISVPNNKSFIRYENFNILNMPPHHMGLWNEQSLRKIGEYFGLQFIDMAFEPLQDYHFQWYTDLMIREKMGKYLSKIALKSIKQLNLRKFINKQLKSRALKIKGHSILIVFKKTSDNPRFEAQ